VTQKGQFTASRRSKYHTAYRKKDENEEKDLVEDKTKSAQHLSLFPCDFCV
jgi:hypothetical protein